MAVTNEGKGATVGNSNPCDSDRVQVIVSVAELQPESVFELLRLRAKDGNRVSEADVGTIRMTAATHHDLCVFLVTRTLILA